METILLLMALLAAPPALRDLCRRAEAGEPEALYRLAYLHDVGYDSIPVDTLRSTELYRRSAEGGFAPAQNYLGYRLLRGEGVPRDVTAGLQWIEKAAIAGDAKAASNLGYLLLHDDAVEHDAEKAVFWLRRAADAGLPVAQSQLADLLQRGEGVAQDSVAALRLWTQAAEGGLDDARLRIAQALGNEETGDREQETGNREQDTGDRSQEAGDREQEAGDRDEIREVYAKAYAVLGDSYARGLGVPYSYEKSMEAYRRAAELGDPRARRYMEEHRALFPDR